MDTGTGTGTPLEYTVYCNACSMLPVLRDEQLSELSAPGFGFKLQNKFNRGKVKIKICSFESEFIENVAVGYQRQYLLWAINWCWPEQLAPVPVSGTTRQYGLLTEEKHVGRESFGSGQPPGLPSFLNFDTLLKVFDEMLKLDTDVFNLIVSVASHYCPKQKVGSS